MITAQIFNPIHPSSVPSRSQLTDYDTSPLVASALLASATTPWGAGEVGLVGSLRSYFDHPHFRWFFLR